VGVGEDGEEFCALLIVVFAEFGEGGHAVVDDDPVFFLGEVAF